MIHPSHQIINSNLKRRMDEFVRLVKCPGRIFFALKGCLPFLFDHICVFVDGGGRGTSLPCLKLVTRTHSPTRA